tara:strand:+ start:841 stop:1725 length:885 start_codon:yes stop_codon:yes gene_type:complete
MNKIFLSFFLLIFCLSANANKHSSSIIYGVGERQTEVDWNIAGNLSGTNPNIISELEWKKIKSHQFLLGNVLQSGEYFLKFFGEYGFVYDGENQDSDYNLDNRKGEFSRSVNNSGKGYLLDAGISYGRDYKFQGKFKLSPKVGYSFHRQHLKIYDGKMVIGSADLTGLDSLYEANWSGPQVGIGLKYKKNNGVFSLDYSLQNIDFNGHTNWNLRSDLKHPESMTQKGKGSGTKISASYEVAVSNFSSLNLVGNFYKYKADGTHTFHLVSRDASQKLNEVNWKGSEIKLIYRSLF